MNVYILTEQKYDETSILGVFATEELAQEHIDWIAENKRNRRYVNLDAFSIIKEVVEGI